MFFLGFVQFPYSRGVYLNRLPKANCFSEVSFDSERKGTQSKVACAKSKLAQNIENQWGRSSDIVGSRIHVSSVSRVWFVSIVQFSYYFAFILRLDDPSFLSESKVNTAAPLHAPSQIQSQ